MANHDYVIANGTGSTVRADLNSALQAILTNNSGNSAPSTTAQGQLWWDADGNTLYIRNTDDNAWLEVGLLTATQTMTNKTLTSPDINGGTADDLTSLTALADGTLKTADGAILNLQTSDTTVTDGSVLGSVQFKAPAEDSGTDAILTGAEIAAVAEGTFAADANATELVFKTGASEAATQKMVLTSGGNLGLGTTGPTIDSSLAGLSIGGKVLHVHDGSGASLKLTDADSGANRGLGIASVGVEASISNCEAGALRFGTSNTERCRIDQSGRFMVNADTTVGYFDGQFLCQGRAHFRHDSNDMVMIWNEQTSGTAYFMRFGHGSSWSEVGTISHAIGGSTAYNTSSDYRLKNVGGEIENATAKIKALKPITYSWKTTPDIENDGFLAHEVAEAGFDFAVTGEKDAITDDGSIQAQQLDQSKLIPALVKTIQELEARITVLEGD